MKKNEKKPVTLEIDNETYAFVVDYAKKHGNVSVASVIRFALYDFFCPEKTTKTARKTIEK